MEQTGTRWPSWTFGGQGTPLGDRGGHSGPWGQVGTHKRPSEGNWGSLELEKTLKETIVGSNEGNWGFRRTQGSLEVISVSIRGYSRSQGSNEVI